jgi:hypothetical protein
MFAVAVAGLEEVVIDGTDSEVVAASGLADGFAHDSEVEGDEVVAGDGPGLLVDRIFAVTMAGLEEVVVAILIGVEKTKLDSESEGDDDSDADMVAGDGLGLQVDCVFAVAIALTGQPGFEEVVIVLIGICTT